MIIHPFDKAVADCKRLFLAAFFSGFFINMLMLAVPIYSLQVLDRVLSSGSTNTLAALTIIVAICLFFMGVMNTLRTMIFNHIGRWLDDRLSTDVVKRMVAFAVHEPKLGSQPLRDLATVRGFVTSPHFGNLFDGPWAIIFFIVIYIINVQLGLIVTAGALLMALLAFIAERYPSKSRSGAADEQLKSMQAIDSILHNAEVIKSMGLLENATKRWKEHNLASLDHNFSANGRTAVIGQITKSIRLSLQVIVMGIGAWFAISGSMTPGAIIAVSILTSRALAPFDALAPLYQSLVSVRKAISRLKDLDQVDSLVTQTMVMPKIDGAVSLKKVSYETPHTKKWVLKNVTADITPGEAIGIIGPSGSGKTTLARLIANVVAPSAGQIEIDKAALYQWDPTQLSKLIGYLPQTVELFDGTVAQNIARLDDNADDSSVVKAAQNAQVHEFILSLPEGYHTQIGVGGALLSAGQRQRIALARCFYGEPKVLILDEPNANLDNDGEVAFARALETAKEMGITTLTIAHRPTVLQCVDKIMVLQKGELKLFGETKEVLAEFSASSRKIQPIPQKHKKVQANVG